MNRINYLKRVLNFMLVFILAFTNLSLTGLTVNARPAPTPTDLLVNQQVEHWADRSDCFGSSTLDSAVGGLVTYKQYVRYHLNNLDNIPTNVSGAYVTNYGYCANISLWSVQGYAASIGLDATTVNKAVYYVLRNGARTDDAWGRVGNTYIPLATPYDPSGQRTPTGKPGYSGPCYNPKYRSNDSKTDYLLTQACIWCCILSDGLPQSYIDTLKGANATQAQQLYYDAQAFKNNPMTKTGSVGSTVLFDKDGNPVTQLASVNLQSKQSGQWVDSSKKIEWKLSSLDSVTGWGEGVDAFTTRATPYKLTADGSSTVISFSSPYLSKVINNSNYRASNEEIKIFVGDSEGKNFELANSLNEIKNGSTFYLSVPIDRVQDYMINNNAEVFSIETKVQCSVSSANKLSVATETGRISWKGSLRQGLVSILEIANITHEPDEKTGLAEIRVGFVEVTKKFEGTPLQTNLKDGIEAEGFDGYQFALVDKNGVIRYSGTTNKKGVVKFNAVVPGNYTLKETSNNEYTLQAQESVGQDVLVEPGKLTKKTFTNDLRYIDLTVKKYAEDAKYDDIRFRLTGDTKEFYTEGNVFHVPSMKVDIAFPPLNENHETTITGLLPGQYTVTESTPSRYVEVVPKSFELAYNGVNLQTIVTKLKLDYVLEDNAKPDYGFTNLKKRIQIPIQKVDSDQFVTGSELDKHDGTSYHAEYNKKSSEALSFEGAVFEIYADETITGQICMNHEHADAETKKACPNCEYWEAGELVWTLTTNENGYATTDANDSEATVATNAYSYYHESTGSKTGMQGLPAGRYHIEEKKAPEGYLRAVKRNSEGRPVDVNGKVIYDLDKYGNEITDEMGANSPQMIIGTFAQDRPEAVPLEYVVDGSAINLTEISTTMDTTLFENAPMKRDIHITKHLEGDEQDKDEDGKHCAGSGIKFTLTSVLGDIEYTAVTNSEGEATFKDVLYGDYELNEIRTASFYTCPNDKASLTSANYATEKEIEAWKKENKVTTPDKFGDVYVKCSECGEIFKTVVTGNEGYALMDPVPVTVNTDHSNGDGIFGYNTPQHYPLGNQLNYQYIQFVKKDDDTKKNVLIPEGAVFKIKDLSTDEYITQNTYVDGEFVLIDTYKVNARGFIVLHDKLRPGKYQLEEIAAPENYILYKDPIQFELDGDGLVDTGLLTDSFSGGHVSLSISNFVGISETASMATEGIVATFFDAPQYGKIKITKTGEGFTAETVKTETIGSKLNDDEEDVEVHTPVYSQVSIPGAVFGIYAKEEINTYDHQLNADGSRIVHYEKDELIEKVTTDEEGIAISGELPIGSYYVVELQAPIGYTLDTTPHYADVLYAGQEELVAIDGNLGLSDARQRLVVRPFIKHMEVNEIFQVGIGEERNDVFFGIFASRDMTDAKGNVVIKQDSLLDVETVDEEGYVKFDVDLPYYQKVGDFGIDGYYYVKELKTNKKYILDNTAYAAEFSWTLENSKQGTLVQDINREETIVTTIENYIQHGPGEFTKTDLVTDETLPNAGIRITDLNGNMFFEGYTDRMGKIVIDDIPVGTYYYQEFDAPEGYVIDTNKYEFTIEKGPNGETNIVKAEMKNKQITSDIEIVKYEENSTTTLPNCGIVIKDAEGEEVFRGYTDEHGRIFIKALPYGTYTAQEVEAPKGYVLDDRIITFNVTAETEDEVIRLSFYDEPVKGSIQIHKQDVSTSESLPNTGIRITDKSTNEVVFEGYTDENGDLTMSGLTAEDGISLRAGKYDFYEFDAPEGYVLPEEHFEFEITEAGQIIKSVMTNKKIVGDVLITKTDIVTSEPLPNTGIRITNENGDVIVEGRTDENGEFKFEGLEYGKYFYQEFDAPDGYVLDETPWPFEIKENGEVVKCQLQDKKIEGTFDFTKQDLVTDKGLPDTGIKIKNEKGEVIFDGRTDKDGKIVIENLGYGKYTYEEYDAPKGYILDTNAYPFEIKENGEIVKAVMKNEKITSKFELTKTDYVDSAPLPDAGIRIVNKDTGELVLEDYTDSNGKIVIDELPYGNYTYQEFEAPKGYTIDTTPYPFSVTEDGAVIRCQLKNVKETTPYTGDVSPIAILVGIGVIAILAVTSFVLINKKRKKDED